MASTNLEMSIKTLREYIRKIWIGLNIIERGETNSYD